MEIPLLVVQMQMVKIYLFTDGNFIDVYLNGVRLKSGEDYNTGTANTVAGLSALNANDEVNVVVYDTFTVADTVQASTGGTFSGSVTTTGDLGVGDDVNLTSDSAVLSFGADSEIKVTHVADTGLKLTDDGGTPTLQLHDSNESVECYDGTNLILTSGGTAFKMRHQMEQVTKFFKQMVLVFYHLQL